MKSIRYIFSDRRDEEWGLTVTTVGFEKTGPDTLYPSDSHPDQYRFSIDIGRTLPEYQLIYVTEGHGVFRSASTGHSELPAGSYIMIHPGEWHTYHPDAATGWGHYWIGFKGEEIDQKVAKGFFTKENSILEIGYNTELIRLFRRALEVAEEDGPQSQQMLAGLVSHMLSLFYTKSRQTAEDERQAAKKTEESIKAACRIMQENIESAISMEEVAERVDLNYSTFRKHFRSVTGESPFSYFQRLKIEAAKELLTESDISIKEIAYRLSFQTADYFSARFKKIVGCTPTDFRENPFLPPPPRKFHYKSLIINILYNYIKKQQPPKPLTQGHQPAPRT